MKWGFILFIVFVKSAKSEEEEICPHGAVFWPHADCNYYYYCNRGYPHQMKCPEDTYWNQRISACDFLHKVPECEGGTRPPVGTTLPSTLAPVTTREPTSTTNTEKPQPIPDGAYVIVCYASGLQKPMSVFESRLTDGNKIHVANAIPNCSDLSQVWKVEAESVEGTYFVRSTLGAGSNKLQHGLHCDSEEPYIFTYRTHNNWRDSFWTIAQVPGNPRFYTFLSGVWDSAVTYSWVESTSGINLAMTSLNTTDYSQWWEVIPCPSSI